MLHLMHTRVILNYIWWRKHKQVFVLCTHKST